MKLAYQCPEVLRFFAHGTCRTPTDLQGAGDSLAEEEGAEIIDAVTCLDCLNWKPRNVKTLCRCTAVEQHQLVTIAQAHTMDVLDFAMAANVATERIIAIWPFNCKKAYAAKKAFYGSETTCYI